VTSNICGVQCEGTTTAEDVLRDLKSTIDRQSEGFYTINEAAQIWADARGTNPKKQREKLWKEIEKGMLTAFDEADKFETLEFSGSVKYSCLVREADLKEIGVFSKVHAKAPAQETSTPAPVVAASDDTDKRRAKKPTIETVALDYMREVYKNGQFQSAAKFHKHLIKLAGANNSPFQIGIGEHARKLFCPAASNFF